MLFCSVFAELPSEFVTISPLRFIGYESAAQGGVREIMAAVLSPRCLPSSVWVWVGDLAQRAFSVPTPMFQLGGGRRRHVVLFVALADRIPRACSRK